MKAIRECLKDYHNNIEVHGIEYEDEIVKEIKKIVLDMVGEDINDKCDYTNGYNYAKAEIKKKVEGEL